MSLSLHILLRRVIWTYLNYFRLLLQPQFLKHFTILLLFGLIVIVGMFLDNFFLFEVQQIWIALLLTIGLAR